MQHELLTEHSSVAAEAARKVYVIKDGALDESDAPKALKELARLNDFSGDAGSVLVGDDGVLLGAGDGKDALIAAAASDKLTEGQYFFAEEMDKSAATLAAFAWAIGGYRFDRYKSAKAASAVLVAPKNADLAAAERAAGAVAQVRDLVNTPAEDMDPAALEEAARKLAQDHGAKINVIIGDDLLKENFPMVHAVGRAADARPRLIDIKWGDENAPKVTLVGKGVTFDSGGLNMKGATGMSLMKKDMGGAAHALALAGMIMSAKLNLRLRVIVPAVENSVAGNSYRPSDVLSSRKGLSVEIGNTDAEGRLILGDGLALGGEDDPELMISLATLTGAARVALGPEVIPFYTEDDDLAGELAAQSNAVADPVWRMPLWDNYDAMLSSQIADVSHIGGGSFAGSITAALFLRRFTPKDCHWIHFDLYAWRPKPAPGRPAGGEAQAIRAVYEVIANRYPA